MKRIDEYLDELKEKTGSDYKSANLLKINRSAITMIRKRNKMSDETALKIAALLDLPEDELLLSATIARSEGDVKKAWQKISYERVGNLVVLTAITVGLTISEIINQAYIVYYVKYKNYWKKLNFEI